MNLSQTGLRRQPFRTHGKPLELVQYASQRHAMRFLDETCTDVHGLGLFHGPPLSGKTTIVHTSVQAIAIASSKPMLDIPRCGDIAKLPKEANVVNVLNNTARGVVVSIISLGFSNRRWRSTR